MTSAVDVSSLFVPKGSDIVSARGRGFPGVTYRSRVDPILDPKTKLAVLINDSTASAAEIVSGAVQDLDVGVIVGSSRSFGKGLVQNVEDLPFNTALKFTGRLHYENRTVLCTLKENKRILIYHSLHHFLIQLPSTILPAEDAFKV